MGKLQYTDIYSNIVLHLEHSDKRGKDRSPNSFTSMYTVFPATDGKVSVERERHAASPMNKARLWPMASSI
jgi:hypothetical protein